MTDTEPAAPVRETAESIATMEIRGAATIASAAAEALAEQAEAAAASGETASDPAAFRASMRAAGRSLRETRPTAVSLPNALRYVLQRMEGRRSTSCAAASSTRPRRSSASSTARRTTSDRSARTASPTATR